MLFIYDLDETLVGTARIRYLRKQRKWKEIKNHLAETYTRNIIKETYEYTRRKYQNIIVTSSPKSYAEEILNYHNFNLENVKIIGYHDTIMHKPELEPYKLAIGNYKGQVFIIGDKWEDLEKITELENDVVPVIVRCYVDNYDDILEKIQEHAFPTLYKDNIPQITSKNSYILDSVNEDLDKEYNSNDNMNNIFSIKILTENLDGYSLFYYESERKYGKKYTIVKDFDTDIVFYNGNDVVRMFKKYDWNRGYLGNILGHWISQYYKVLFDIDKKFKLKDLIVACIPSSNEEKNIRYQALCSKLQKKKILACWDLFKLKNNIKPKHSVTCLAERKEREKEFEKELIINEKYYEDIKDKNKKILIFDDVITRGRNITICYKKLRELTDIQINFFTIACDKYEQDEKFKNDNRNMEIKLVNPFKNKKGAYLLKQSVIKRSLMMYTIEEMVILSKIFSLYTVERFAKPVVDHELLYAVFKESLAHSSTIFETVKLKGFIEEAVKKLQIKNKRKKYEARAEELELYIREKLAHDSIGYDNALKTAKQEIELAESNGIEIITYLDSSYPLHLKNIDIPPFVLYVKGTLPKENEFKHSLAIIGTREPDKKYGEKLASKLGECLLNAGWYNISGLALGCDELGHKGSLGATGAILGQGLCTEIYPKQNINLAEDIIANGGFLMSEVPPTTKVNAPLLIERDRLQAGLTKGVIVVETSAKSGTFHAVKAALEQDKYVFVVDPSNVKNYKEIKQFEGNIALLSSEGIMSNVSISKSLKNEKKSKIIALLKINELTNYLDKIGKEEFKRNHDDAVSEDPSLVKTQKSFFN